MRGTHITCYHALSIASKRLVYIGNPRKNITLGLLPDGGQMLSREKRDVGWGRDTRAPNFSILIISPERETSRQVYEN